MKFKNIEVNGINNIVFNRKTKWRVVPEGWLAEFEGRTVTHDSMMFIVNQLKRDPRYRMWIHFDTLNVVKK
jgi:hypothetical protein